MRHANRGAIQVLRLTGKGHCQSLVLRAGKEARSTCDDSERDWAVSLPDTGSEEHCELHAV